MIPRKIVIYVMYLWKIQPLPANRAETSFKFASISMGPEQNFTT